MSLAWLAAAGLLAMWLGWAGIRLATGKGLRPSPTKKPAIVFGSMVAASLIIWFAFGLSKKLDFDQPELLLLLLIAMPLFALGAWSLDQLGPARRWLSVYLRVLVLFLIVAMLAGFRTVQRHDELTVVALIDTSESVRRFYQVPPDSDGRPQDYEQWMATWLAGAGADKRPDDYWSVQTFDGRPTILLSPSLGDVALPTGAIDQPFEGSNGQRAIESGMAAKMDAGSALRMLLVSDGNLTGEVMAMVQAAAAAGVQIDVLPLMYQVQNEVMVEAVHATPEARDGQTVQVTVELRSAGEVGGHLQLRHNNVLIDLNGPDEGVGLPIRAEQWQQQARLDNGETAGDDSAATGLYAMTIYIDRPITESGVNSFDALFIPDGENAQASAITANDRGQAFTLVSGPGKVLVIDGVGGAGGQVLPESLLSRGFNAEVRTVSSMPSLLSEMTEFDAILMHNVPADAIPPAVQDNLAQYVHALGGGFVMIGGPDSFGAGGWTNTNIERYILPLYCHIPSQRRLPSGALILVIDSSGSMFGSKGHVAAEAAILSLQTLYPEDLVGVITFDSTTHWIQTLQPNSNPNETANRVRAITQGGGTDIDTGLNAAYEALRGVTMDDAAIRHVVLVTDGHEHVSNYNATAQRYRNAGITLTTIGIGPQNNRALLEPLATLAGGTYHNVADPNRLPQIFIKEARFIRRNLISEVTFTPTLRPVFSPIMQSIDSVPPLQGFVRTEPKRDRGVFMPIIGPEGEPIFAHHQVGLGRAAAFTSDASNRWAQDWLTGWNGQGSYADFWASTVRYIARPPASTQADLITSIDGDTLTLRLDAASDSDFENRRSRGANFGNNLQVRGSVIAPNGQTVEVVLEQVGPGIYETRIPAHESGNYIVDLQMQDDTTRQRVIGGASKAAGGELREFQSNMALLQRIAEETGGRMLDPNNPADAELYNRTTPIESLSTRPLRWQLMPFLLAFLLMDVACRRIAWEGREVADWAKGRANAVLGLMQTRKVEGQSTMAALKANRQQTTEKLAYNDEVLAAPATALGGLAARVKGAAAAGNANEQTQPVGSAKSAKKAKPAPASVSRTRKFVASEQDLAAAKDDFSAAVGGAKTDDSAKPVITPAMRKSEKTQDQGPTTSRLLDAKKRAQQRMNDQEE